MSHQCSLLQEFLSADGARVWYTAMNAPMIDQLKFTRESRATIRTHERIERTMKSRMHYQMVLLGEAFTTLVTNIWSLSGMEFAVRHQMTLQWERTSALLANEWSLAAVGVCGHFGGDGGEREKIPKLKSIKLNCIRFVWKTNGKSGAKMEKSIEEM